MKNIFLIIFLLFIICAPNIAMAQVKLETGLPNIPTSGLTPGQELPSYINYLFIFGLGAITILALAQMMIGGIQYILSAGNVSKKEDAKDTIQQALLGLGLLLASFLLLRTINPDLVNLKNPTLTPLQFKGAQCIEWSAAGLQACMDQGGMSWETCQEAACIRYKGSTPSSAIGGGGTSYQWAIIPMNKYCKDVLGVGWVTVDSNHCGSSSPSISSECCGYFPNNPK